MTVSYPAPLTYNQAGYQQPVPKKKSCAGGAIAGATLGAVTGGVIAASILTPAFIPITLYFLFVIKNEATRQINTSVKNLGFNTVGELKNFITTTELAISQLSEKRTDYVQSTKHLVQ